MSLEIHDYPYLWICDNIRINDKNQLIFYVLYLLKKKTKNLKTHDNIPSCGKYQLPLKMERINDPPSIGK